MPPRIYIAGFAEEDFDAIPALVRPFGVVKSIIFPVNLLTLEPTDAVIEYESEEAATCAAEGLSDTTLGGRRLIVTRQREYAPDRLAAVAGDRDDDRYELKSVAFDVPKFNIDGYIGSE
ncbi:MAG: hypothetical protein ACTHQM_21460 [Thermoanaerobaculia bacterium]